MEDQSNNNQQTSKTANRAPTTHFSVSETHLTISRSKCRPTSFHVLRSLHRKHQDTFFRRTLVRCNRCAFCSTDSLGPFFQERDARQARNKLCDEFEVSGYLAQKHTWLKDELAGRKGTDTAEQQENYEHKQKSDGSEHDGQRDVTHVSR